MGEEEAVATLVVEMDYPTRPNQVAHVSTERLIYIKRRELKRSAFELVEFPWSQCTAVTYQIKWAVAPMVFGLLLVATVVAFFVSDIPSDTTVPVGAMVASIGIGVTLFRGPKRHRLTFTVGGRELRWQSKAGEFKFMWSSAQKVVAFARQRGLLRE